VLKIETAAFVKEPGSDQRNYYFHSDAGCGACASQCPSEPTALPCIVYVRLLSPLFPRFRGPVEEHYGQQAHTIQHEYGGYQYVGKVGRPPCDLIMRSTRATRPGPVLPIAAHWVTGPRLRQLVQTGGLQNICAGAAASPSVSAMRTEASAIGK
jgi:ferredoxin